MEIVKKCVGICVTVVKWILCLLLLTLGFVYFPSPTSVLFLLLILMIVPIKGMQRYITKCFSLFPIRLLLCFVLFMSGVMLAPDMETENKETSEVYIVELESTVSETEGIDFSLNADAILVESESVEIVTLETMATGTEATETKALETKAPETKAPETKAPVKITHEDSSLSPELVEALEGVAAFWAPTGKKIHLNPFCTSFHEVVYAGTVAEANSVKDGGWCRICSKDADENTKSNVNATPEVIANCYSYDDYMHQIPASVFDR